MPISRYAKVLLLAPTIGSALIGVFGLILGVVLISRLGHFPHALATHTTLATLGPAASEPALEQANSTSGSSAPGKPVVLRTGGTNVNVRSSGAGQSGTERSSPRRVNTLFQKPIPGGQLAFLSDYAGRPANGAVREPDLRSLLNRVVPYAPFHLGLDMPLPHAVESMFLASTLPVEVRAGRYAMVTGVRGQGGRGRAFLWVDMKQGVAFGGIFFYPSNGEPTPTLTIFSSQVNRPSLAMSQLPVAFFQDLSRWAVREGVPPVTTRYFINASSEKILLAHDEDYCSQLDGMTAPPPEEVCRKMNADAARIDTEASLFLNRTNFASNATMRTALDRSRP
jgi:hypothetical protein